MPHVLRVPTLQVGHPVPLLILMEPDNLALQGVPLNRWC
jgi:hypothetical protein